MCIRDRKKSETIKKEITLEAKEEAHRMRTEAERDVRERRAEVQRSERRLIQKEESVDRKLENIEKKEESITKHEQEILEKKKELDGFLEKRIEELEKISGLTVDQAKALLLDEIEKDVRHDASLMIKEIESKAKAVSYTHLDVYKRQDHIYAAPASGGDHPVR